MIGLDRIRTAYVHAPPSIRRRISPLLLAIPLRYRFGRTFVTYRALIKRSRVDLDFVATWRRDRLRTIVQTAVLNAPHYQRVFAGTDLAPSTLNSFCVSDLARFPVLTKEEVRGNARDFLTCPVDELDQVTTSGSTSTPFSLYLEKDRSAKEWAFVQDSWSKIGFEPRCVRAVFKGFHLSDADKVPWEFEPALGELRLSPFHLTDTWMQNYCALIIRYDATYLQGYPSLMFIFANFVLRTGRKDISDRISGIISASEILFPHQRELISEAFPRATITSYYGMSEKVLFGSELVDKPGTFEIEPLYGIAELLNDKGDQVVQPGEIGRIIGTGLLFVGMPLIRYDTGDRAILVEAPTEKNLFRMTIKDITSWRSQEYFVGSDGRLIPMTAVNVHSKSFVKMAAFQFHQSKPGKATLKIVPALGCGKSDVVSYVNEISDKVGTSLTFDIEIVDQLPQNTRGKTKYIDQDIDISKLQRAASATEIP
jgi:phenylacetate-coenzyme A ligase PaaK-like adenylate-forming protein